MALSKDQKAMLRLLAQREQGYEDIAALMGVSVEEVRTRVADALAELEDAGEPSAPSQAKEPPQPPPPPPSPPEAVTEEASKEAATSEPPAPAPAPVSAKRSSPRLPTTSIPAERRRFMALVGGALAIVVIVAVALGVFGGSGSSSSSGDTTTTSPSDSSTSDGLTASASKKVVQAVLSPVDGGSAEGLAVFGRLGKKIVLQVEATGLDPSPKGSHYTVWLYKSPKLALRTGAASVSDSGGLALRMQIPEEAFAAAAARVFDQISISLTSDAEYKAEVAKAKKENRLPAYTGTEVLRGPITGPEIKSQK